MKKNIKVSLALICVITLSLFYSCDKESIDIEAPPQETVQVDYGKLHNEALEIYYQNNGFGNIDNISGITQDLYSITKSNHPGLFVNENEQETVQNIVDQFFGTNDLANYNFVEKTTSLLADAAIQGKLSHELANIYIDIVQNNRTKDEILTVLDGFVLEKSSNPNDQNAISIFRSIYMASDNFWQTKDGEETLDREMLLQESDSKCSPWWQRRIADATVGLVGGLLGGPVGGVLAGGAASALVEEMQRQNGGKCI